MNFPSSFSTLRRWAVGGGFRLPLIIGWLPLCGLSLAAMFWSTAAADAQETAIGNPAAGNGNPVAGAAFMPARDLLPKNTAGYVRIANVPEFREAWQKLHIAELIRDPAMKDFVDAQRARAVNFLDSTDHKIGIRPSELFDAISGEVALSWIPFEKDKRRPFSICIIADVRGQHAKSEAALDQIDEDLKNGGAIRQDKVYRGQNIRIYSTKPKPGQLKVSQVAIASNADRVIASDRDTVVQELLDAIAGEPKAEPLSRVVDFKTIMDKSDDALKLTQDDGAKVCIDWFAHPFQMGRILRESLDIDRGNQVDVLKLLEGQGFNAVRAMGGRVAFAGKRFDVVHRGHILATRPFKRAAEMLNLSNKPYAGIPDWIHNEVGSFNRVNWNIEQGFWASESLVNEALGDEIFRDMVDGIRDDAEGPQIDLKNNFLPNLDDTIILIADNTTPATIDSERMLVAVELKDAARIKEVIRKAMEVEPDATKIDALPDVDIWRVQRGESEDDLDAELEALGFDDEEGAGNGQKPLLDHWAIAVVDQGPGSPASYLMFSSHPEFLIESAKRIKAGSKNGLGSLQAAQDVVAAAKDLGANQVAMDRLVRLKTAMRAKYELLRQGQLRESDSVLATIVRRAIDNQSGGEPDPLNAKKLPPISKIEKHLTDGGAFTAETEEGWSLNGFFLRK